MTSSTESIVALGLSDVGRKREHNEDRFVVAHGGRLVAVADGMGGHMAGEVAAAMAIEVLVAEYSVEGGDDASSMSERLAGAIRCANDRIRAAAAKSPKQHNMGTTIVAAAFGRRSAVFAHAGDSRAYLLRRGALLRLTRDHSLREALLQAPPGQELSAEALAQVPGNVILRALGTAPELDAETSVIEVEPGDRFLLCSDGLTGMLTDDEIQTVLANRRDQKELLETLIHLANEAGGQDNVTALVVDRA